MLRPLVRVATLAALMASVVSCSLISWKSPEKPLSTRDLNARILTHEYSAHFIAAVERTADQISAATEDPAVRLNALRWKIAASDKSQRAASQIAPMMGLLDTWALSVQMQQYLADGAGRTLFATQQPLAVTLAAELAGQAEELAGRLTAPDEFDHDKRFIDGYVRAHPIDSLEFARASIVDLWTHDTGAQVRLLDSLGTVPEALADAGDLLRMYGDTGPSQLLWKAQLAAQESGLSGKELQLALQRLHERMAALSVMADETPDLVKGVVRDVRMRFNASWAEMLGALHAEGRTLSVSVSDERQAAVEAVDVERAAVAADAARIGSQVTGTHAAVLAVSVPASRAPDALLGGTGEAEDSFPHTEVRHLDPIRIFRAAFWSRSCDSPQSLHTHDLTINPLTPRGPLRAPQAEQVTLVFLSLMTANVLAACWLLYSKKSLSSPQPESSTHFAIRVLASLRLLTSPTMIL